MTSDIHEIIDLDRYPIYDPDNPVTRSLLETGKKALQEKSLFSMAGFIRPEVISNMAKELEQLVPRSCRYDEMRSSYDYDDEIWPDSHPRHLVHRCAYNQVLNYQIPNDSLIRQVYYWQPLTDFLRILCDYETFYRSDCPHLALTSKVAGNGDTDGWHFDTNDVVFSVLLQTPEGGGEFEYGPNIRSEEDENYAGVSAFIANPRIHADRPAIAVGDLTVFKGDLSIHRVTAVTGNRKRIVALFSYDQMPGTTFSQNYIESLNEALPGPA